MCLILFAYRSRQDLPLVVAANRDEFFERPTGIAHFWPHQPSLLAGRDLQAGGTWLGITRHGRFAAVTNLRGHPNPALALSQNPPSRGRLTHDFLISTQTGRDYCNTVMANAEYYGGFNLLVFDGEELLYCHNRFGDDKSAIQALAPGVYGLSNGLLNEDWPKVTTGKTQLQNLLDSESVNSESLLKLLHDDQPHPDSLLPDTGVGKDLERTLSPRFIRAGTGGYGTCNSTALIMQSDSISFHERSFYTKPYQSVPTDQDFRFSY